ncbi:unnamed protein product [Allacma fusca]|uniref:Cleavage and polyadenylation specificity factor subunit 2 n=1 Tax=Allacma fusca TaxID=39272 RepID=A0A8J2JK31_9HEXA|nr:unnamed protein product [Allacma fusca]
MTSIIKLQAFSGVMGETPPCYILQVDEFRFLLDCGLDERLSMTYINELKKHVNRIDAVLISHPDLIHLGALPYLVGKCGLSCPVYTTIPVFKMGQMFMYDFYLSKRNNENFDLFNLDDVDAAFDKIIQLKYNQSINLKGKGYGLTITPLPAGHMIGGTIWRIVKVGEEDIYYAVDYNHKKERHLNGCELDKIQRPSLLITDSFNATYVQARRRTRDEQLMTNILQTLKNGGNVLIAVDTAGRVLELAHMLDQLWRNKESGLVQYSLAYLNNVAYNVMEFAKSQIEWMSEKLMRSFEGARNNPFQFRHVQICHRLADVQKIQGPKVVLASTPDLESGFSRELFMLWCQDSKNSLILTTKTSPGTLARILMDDPTPKLIEVEVKQRVKLEGLELEEFYRQQREKEYRVKKEKREAMMDSDDSDDSDTEIKITGIYHGNRVSHDLFIKPGMELKIETGLFKSAKSKYPVFPCVEEKIKYDEYGEFIRADDFVISDYAVEDVKAGNSRIPGAAVGAPAGDLENEPPTKCLVSKQKLAVNCQICYIDFEGRSDGESIRKIVEQVKPRRLIVTRGPKESTDVLAGVCKQSGVGTKVYTPCVGDVVDVTTESHIYQVRLKDSLVSSLDMKRGRDAELAWIDAYLLMEEEQMEVEPEITDDDAKIIKSEPEISQLVPTLAPITDKQIPPHPTVFVNELKLSDFKLVLARNGIVSEFSGGVLWCANGTVALRRQDAGKLTVEGCLCDEYYQIRSLLYDQYAIL